MNARLTTLSVLLIAAASHPLLAETPSIGATPPAAPAISDTQAAATAQSVSTDPKLGQTEAQVFMLLGRPAGYVETPLRITLMYGRGTVTLRQGVVTNVALISEADYEARMALQAESDAQHQAQHLRANALLGELMNDPNYTAMATRDRLLALERFDREHPGSDAERFYDDLMAVYNAEQAAQNRVKELEQELAEAREAEAEAQSVAQQQSSSNTTSTTSNPTPINPNVSYVYYVPYTATTTATTTSNLPLGGISSGLKVPGVSATTTTPTVPRVVIP